MSEVKSPAGGNIVVGFFLKVRDELRQVTWPTRAETIRLTVMVIGVTVATGLILGGLDYVFTQLMGLIL